MVIRAAVVVVAAASAVALLPGVAHADGTYDLYTVASGYTTAANGAYTYDLVPAASYASPGAYVPVTTAGPGDDGLPGFHASDGGNFPYFSVNTSGSPYVDGSQTVPPKSFVAHPGPTDDAVVVFTVPGGGAGTVSATITFSSDDPGSAGDSTSGALFATDASGAVVAGSTVLTPRPRQGSTTLTIPATQVPAGGHVYAVLDKNSYYNADSTGVSMQATVVGSPATSLPEAPLAAALPLVGVACLGAGIAIRRRRR